MHCGGYRPIARDCFSGIWHSMICPRFASSGFGRCVINFIGQQDRLAQMLRKGTPEAAAKIGRVFMSMRLALRGKAVIGISKLVTYSTMKCSNTD